MNIKWNNEVEKLTSFSVTGDVPEVIEEFIIPSVVDGKQILVISTMRASFQSLWVKGVKQIKRLIVEDGIKRVANWAFAYIRVKIDEFYWPSTCNTIPHGCFDSSAICGIKGIDNVTTIEPYAFAYSEISEMVWPATCSTIPKGCFYCSTLKNISGIEDVTEIGPESFGLTEIEIFNWPPKISANCFSLGNCYHLKKIVFDGCEMKDIDLNIFSSLFATIEEIDLSKIHIVNLTKSISDDSMYFKILDRLKDKLHLPYYVNRS